MILELLSIFATGPSKDTTPNNSNSSVTTATTQPRVKIEENRSSIKTLSQRDCLSIDDEDDEKILGKAIFAGIIVAIGLGVVFYRMKDSK